MTDDCIQVRRDGNLHYNVTIDAHEVVVMTVWDADGKESICRLELPAATARRLAAGLLSAAEADHGSTAT